MNRNYVINLVTRPDRRREMEAELVSMGWPGPLEWLSETRPTEKGEWPSPGYRGCFMSHFKALVRGRDSGHSSFAVFEDDCEFWHGAVQRLHVIERCLEEREWDLCYLGHYLPTVSDEFGLAEISPCQVMPTAHAYMVNRRAVTALVEWFDLVSCRPQGSPLGGPQSPDGAFSTYREQNPTVRTFAASPPLCKQRPSRSDLSPRWFDSMPGLRDLAAAGRRRIRLNTKH